MWYPSNSQLKICVLLNVFIAYYYVYIYFQDNTFEKTPDTVTRARYHAKSKASKSLKNSSQSGCKLPKLSPFSSQVIRYHWRPSPIVCGGQDWVRCYHSTCKVIPEILNTTSNITCIYKDIMYYNDRGYSMSARTVLEDDEEYILERSDHVKIWCTGTRNNSEVTWVGVATGFRTLIMRNPVPEGRENALNVLVLGFDSTSKNGFIRQMPKSYRHLTKVMGGVVLDGHNIVGTGTAAALIPILTGMSISEVPDARYSPSNNITADDIPLIFSILNDYGYRTAYFEDMPWIGTFQYRFNGFNDQPADHYLRAFYMVENKVYPRNLYCVGDTAMHKLMMNISHQFLRLDGQKFILTFIADITHDQFNLISTADTNLVALLDILKKEGFLENTLIIVMGDHGARYEPIRNTYQGKLEECLPLMVVILPEELKIRRPEALAALHHNKRGLTTHFDIHATLMDVLDLNDLRNNYKAPGSDLERGMSLLEKIPIRRTCDDAGIHPHFCACAEWVNMSNAEPMYARTAHALAKYIDDIVEEKRELCARRDLASIKWVMRYIPKNKTALIIYYQAKIILSPGNSMFEGTMTYDVLSDNFYIDPNYISGPYAVHVKCWCLDKLYVHLFSFCQCINQVDNKNVTNN